MNLSKRLQDILDAENLTIYGASQIVEAETAEPLKTIHQRLARYLKSPPGSYLAIEKTLAALGYEVRIEKRSGSVKRLDQRRDI